MALPSCVKMLEHWVEDRLGTGFTLDPQNRPTPNFVTGFARLDTLFDDALNKTGRTSLGTLLHAKTGAADIDTLFELDVGPYTLSIALADLTGDENDPNSKVFHPQYVAYHDRAVIYPGSLSKIGPIYAAHQLKFDADHIATGAPAATQANPAKLKKYVFDKLRADWKTAGIPGSDRPVLEEILVVNSQTFALTKTFAKRMNDITHPPDDTDWKKHNPMNEGMDHLVRRLQFPYMGSLFLQSGLADPATGGFWIWQWNIQWLCKGRITRLYSGQDNLDMQALSVATYLALLAQERLISRAVSKELKDVLVDGDAGWFRNACTTKLPPGDKANLRFWGKHGAVGAHASEGLLVERKVQGQWIRYIVVCLLDTKRKRSDYSYFDSEEQKKKDPPDPLSDLLLTVLVEELIPVLDGVILANNSPPHP